jgi:hypothetical protein
MTARQPSVRYGDFSVPRAAGGRPQYAADERLLRILDGPGRNNCMLMRDMPGEVLARTGP